MAANLAPISSLVGEAADLRGMRECLQWFTREKQWINDIHLQLCRVPAPTFLEQQRAEWILAQFRNLGWEGHVDRAGNVVAMPDARSEGPYVALTAHLDTVLAPRVKEDIRVEPGGRFHGPGISDNGAGLAALLAIARALKVCPPVEGWYADLLLVANVGEEGEGNLSGMRHLCKQSSVGGAPADPQPRRWRAPKWTSARRVTRRWMSWWIGSPPPSSARWKSRISAPPAARWR